MNTLYTIRIHLFHLGTTLDIASFVPLVHSDVVRGVQPLRVVYLKGRNNCPNLLDYEGWSV